MYSHYTASDTHLYFASRIEPLDGGNDVWTVARAPLTGTADDVEDLADGEHDGFAWGNDKLYYLEEGFFEWDPGTGQETMLLDNSMMGPPPETAYIVDGHYVGYANQGGVTINLTTLEMRELDTDGWFYSFIADGRLFYVANDGVAAIDVP